MQEVSGAQFLLSASLKLEPDILDAFDDTSGKSRLKNAASEVIAAEKLSGGLRPLQMGSVCRRISMSGICRLLRIDVQAAAGCDQLGVGASDGCTKIFHDARTKCRQDSQRGIVARDIESAH